MYLQVTSPIPTLKLTFIETFAFDAVLSVGVIPTAIPIIIVTFWVVHNIITVSITNPILIITSFSVTNTSLTNNEFITCFSRIYDFFSRNFMLHFLEGSKVSFSGMIDSFIGIFDLNRKLLLCRKTKQTKFCEKN